MITLLMLPTSKVLAHFRLWLCSAHLSIKALTLLECQRSATTRPDKVLKSSLCHPPARQQTTHSGRDTFSSIYLCITKNVAYSSAFTFSHLIMFLKGIQWLFKKLNSYRLYLHWKWTFTNSCGQLIYLAVLFLCKDSTIWRSDLLLKIQQIVLLHGLKNLFFWWIS